ncbi:cytosolic 5'-nucleotidase 1B-like isoform X2 [Myxocyprinus asiaticus]|uniref:cytosolic 5'-nucleotidase 1B-like isoform X2 n=1 Tax=Myxocyprinus asiaticus TaxID=70543 RepID=UPI0022224DDB|nr:cytosolic 5'-nucleotidase 1B-like isoform X2 [Myxocyprinus asiaticus]XP_051548074.1 cytosolic 5'-nucleotidase 1B-like isoform X2 [Myxocyprinus asiaticus]
MEDNKNFKGPLIIALQYNDIFDLHSVSVSTSTNTDAEPLPKGRAFTFIKAVQTVNEKLVSQNKTESLLFEVILYAKECSEQIKRKIVESVKHYGLEIGKFYFCKKEELMNTLQLHKVKLFLSTDGDDIYRALHTGIPAALLYGQADQHSSDQLKVIFSGDIIGFSEDSLDSLTDFGFSETQIQTFKTAKPAGTCCALCVNLSPLASRGALATDTRGCSLLPPQYRARLPCWRLRFESRSEWFKQDRLQWCHDPDGSEL